MTTIPGLNCPFCEIAATFASDGQLVPQNHDHEQMVPNCHLLLNAPTVLAFLDIMPIAEGHVLLIPRQHREKLKDLTGEESAQLGLWLPIVSKAVMKALGRADGDWNVVQNNGASAAQVIPHCHYHIIPRNAAIPDTRARSWTMFGRGQRQELDDEDAIRLAASIRAELTKELKSVTENDEFSRKFLGKL